MSVVSFRRVDADVALYVPDSKKVDKNFRFWHVETLLNSAADLLDRCIAEQSRFEALYAQKASLECSLTAEINAVRLETDKQEAQRAHHLRPLLDAQEKQDRLEQMHTAYEQARIEYSEGNTEVQSDKDNKNKSAAQAAIHTHAIAIARWEMELSEARREVERAEEKDMGYVAIQERNLDDASALLEKKRSFIESGKELDFGGQAERVRRRVIRDYEDAVDRLVAAADGLAKIYGYHGYVNKDEKAGKIGALIAFKPQLDLVNQGILQPIETATTWVREAIRWLSVFTQHDQTFTVTVSIKRALETKWPQLIENEMESGPVEFPVDESLFKLHRYVRLRGISATSQLLSTASPFPIRCVVTVPKQACHVLNVDGEFKESEVRQRFMPSCVLGRVTDVRIPQDPEICGAISLMNASPIGRGDHPLWSIQVQRIAESPLTEIEDIFLEIKVSGQPIDTEKQ